MPDPRDPAIEPAPEPGAAASGVAGDDEDLYGEDDVETPFDGAGPSTAPGPRRLVVPEGEIIRRVDRFVADRTGLSRSYVQKLISEGLLGRRQGRRLRANSEVRGGRHPRGPAAGDPVPPGARIPPSWSRSSTRTTTC